VCPWATRGVANALQRGVVWVTNLHPPFSLETRDQGWYLLAPPRSPNCERLVAYHFGGQSFLSTLPVVRPQPAPLPIFNQTCIERVPRSGNRDAPLGESELAGDAGCLPSPAMASSLPSETCEYAPGGIPAHSPCSAASSRRPSRPISQITEEERRLPVPGWTT
jgi:hypothetical protein